MLTDWRVIGRIVVRAAMAVLILLSLYAFAGDVSGRDTLAFLFDLLLA